MSSDLLLSHAITDMGSAVSERWTMVWADCRAPSTSADSNLASVPSRRQQIGSGSRWIESRRPTTFSLVMIREKDLTFSTSDQDEGLSGCRDGHAKTKC